MAATQNYNCFSFVCVRISSFYGRLKKIFPKNKKSKNPERHRGKFPTPSPKSGRKVSETTRKESTSSSYSDVDGGATKRGRSQSTDNPTRKTSSSSALSQRSRSESTDVTRKTSLPQSMTSSQVRNSGRARKTSTTYSKKLNYAVDMDTNCQPKYAANISATSNSPQRREPSSPRVRAVREENARELRDIASPPSPKMETITEQNITKKKENSTTNKRSANRLRWQRSLSIVKDKKTKQ